MKRNVSVVCVCSVPNCCDTVQRSASQLGSVASGTHCIIATKFEQEYVRCVRNERECVCNVCL